VLSLFDRKHSAPISYYTVIYATINGRLYTKDASAEDYGSRFVTFGDGTRVSWTDVKTKKTPLYPDELGATVATNISQ
jgi:hypothetical protein